MRMSLTGIWIQNKTEICCYFKSNLYAKGVLWISLAEAETHRINSVYSISTEEEFLNQKKNCQYEKGDMYIIKMFLYHNKSFRNSTQISVIVVTTYSNAPFILSYNDLTYTHCTKIPYCSTYSMSLWTFQYWNPKRLQAALKIITASTLSRKEIEIGRQRKVINKIHKIDWNSSWTET